MAEPIPGVTSALVVIDGVETVLTFDRFSGARGYQYLTPPGNAGSHAFNAPLRAGECFRTNGRRYHILAVRG